MSTFSKRPLMVLRRLALRMRMEGPTSVFGPIPVVDWCAFYAFVRLSSLPIFILHTYTLPLSLSIAHTRTHCPQPCTWQLHLVRSPSCSTTPTTTHQHQTLKHSCLFPSLPSSSHSRSLLGIKGGAIPACRRASRAEQALPAWSCICVCLKIRG